MLGIGRLRGRGAGLGISAICSSHARTHGERATARSSLRKLPVECGTCARARPRQADVASDVQGHAGAQRSTLARNIASTAGLSSSHLSRGLTVARVSGLASGARATSLVLI